VRGLPSTTITTPGRTARMFVAIVWYSSASTLIVLMPRSASSSTSGTGINVMGQIGAGIMRDTIKLSNGTSGMDTDVVAQGPLLIGGGVGYIKPLSGSLSLVADASAIAGIAVTSSLGSAPKLTSGLTTDLSLGLLVGF